jgi:hypothetical protein
MMTVTGNKVSLDRFPGSAREVVRLGPGDYSVRESESDPDGYTTSRSEQCAGTIEAGERRTCTITNDDMVTLDPQNGECTLSMEVWDHHLDDGDIIDLDIIDRETRNFVESILSNHEIATFRPTEVTTTIKRGQKYLLVVKARNQGRIGPNTVAVKILTPNFKSQRLELRTGGKEIIDGVQCNEDTVDGSVRP